MSAKFDHGQSAEHAILIHDKMIVYKHEQITFHEQEIGAILDRQKPSTRNVDSVSIPEVPDSRSCCRLKLLILSKLASLLYTERLDTCKTDRPSSNVLLLAMISRSKPSFSTTRLRAERKAMLFL